jgi:cobalt/nickel transport system ATP-binding protein
MGDNGAGKSTLLLCTVGLLLPCRGSITACDISLDARTAPTVRRHVGIVFANPDDQLFMPTVADDVAFGPINMGLPEQEVRRRVETSLAAVGALHLGHRRPCTLSSGQKRIVAIATVLAMQPDVILMDEPTSNLDPTAVCRLENLLLGLPHTCLIATHDATFASTVCSRKVQLPQGRNV